MSYSVRVRIEAKLEPFPLHFCIEYAYAIALTVQHLETSAESRKCLELVAKWLNDENSVTREEAREAYYAAAARSALTSDLPTTATYALAITLGVAIGIEFHAGIVSRACAYKPPFNGALEYEAMLDEKINNLSEIERLIYNYKGL